jgi:hypothetical protein
VKAQLCVVYDNNELGAEKIQKKERDWEIKSRKLKAESPKLVLLRPKIPDFPVIF